MFEHQIWFPFMKGLVHYNIFWNDKLLIPKSLPRHLKTHNFHICWIKHTTSTKSMDLPVHMLCSLQTPSHRFFYRSAREKQITTSILSYTQNSSPHSTDFIWTTYREVQWSRVWGSWTAHLTVQISYELRTEKCSDQECGCPDCHTYC